MSLHDETASSARKAPVRIGVILAGGASRRMGGVDKAAVKLGGRRLIDHVIARLAPQTDRILIAGPHDYGAGRVVVSDRRDGPRGPAAGLWAAAHWIAEHEPDAKGFLAAPADGPFLPDDLWEKLTARGACSVASDGERDHPTFAYWPLARLLQTLGALSPQESLSLHALAAQCNARSVAFHPASTLFNVNSRNDFAAAEQLLTATRRRKRY